MFVYRREEIANLVGTATESTIRLLSDFKKDGMVELDGKENKNPPSINYCYRLPTCRTNHV